MAGKRRDTDEGHTSSLGASGVIDGVADIPEFGARREPADFEQSIRRRLVIRHITGADNGLELEMGSEAAQGQLGFPTEASGEQRELKLLVQPIEHTFLSDPALAQNQAIAAVAVENAL